MLRLRSYLYPYIWMFAMAVVLLFIQANLDLALPDYLSRIVNTGIQQNGVDSTLPQVIRQEQLDKVRLFLNGEDLAAVNDAYIPVEPGIPDYDSLLAQFPLMSEQPVLALGSLPEREIERLALPFGKALLAVTAIEELSRDPQAATDLVPGFDPGFDPAQIPAGTDLFVLLAQLPESSRLRVVDAIDARFEALGESMVSQTAVLEVKAEYEALGADIQSLQTSYILRVGAIMLVITLLSALATISVGYLSARTAAGVGRDLRRDVFQKVERFSSAEFDRFSTASLITRNTNDVTQLQSVTMIMMRMVFYAPIMGIGGIIRAVGKSASMWWIIALAVLVLICLVILIVSIAMPKFRLIQQLIDRLNLVAREQLSGMMVIRAFNRQPFEQERFDKANQDLTSNTLFISRVIALMMPLMMLILNVMSVVILWVGAQQVAQANIQVGDMIAFMQYAMQIVWSFLMLSMLFIILPRASVSAERIADVLETVPTIRDPQEPIPLNGNTRGQIDFNKVSFRYPGAEEDVLHDISFTAQPGQTTAFIGSTGSGKSTVVNLIPRFYDVTSGAILVDGVDIRQVTQHDLREKIGYVPQKGQLFSGTISSNLHYADEQAGESNLREALDTAQASEFVFEKPDGLQTEIAQGGSNVSGGQRQRLSIARALVKQSPIYIFDDSFSALDFKTDAALRRALKAQTGHSTVLLVTQRVSTVMNAEQIIVLDEGKLVGKGTHQELMETCETYREIAMSQLSLEELS